MNVFILNSLNNLCIMIASTKLFHHHFLAAAAAAAALAFASSYYFLTSAKSLSCTPFISSGL